MDFRIADTFTESLGRLSADEQKAVKMTAFDLQMNPSHPGLSFHKLDRAKDKNFWSVRAGADIRLIVHRTKDSLLICYVDHHDKAYAWAERRKLETHPKTGAAQIVEIRETVREIVVPTFVHREAAPPAARRLFEGFSEDQILGMGVPMEWVPDVMAATEDSLLSIATHLPAEAAEALLELATGGRPRGAKALVAVADPFEHPDAQRRFRVMTNEDELRQALDYPWEKWMVFLHPEQRQCVDRNYGGPARVAGSAGTGKTIVAIHRAAHLARSHPEARVLLTTYSDSLANALENRMRRLLGSEPKLAERIDVHSLPAIGRRLYRAAFGDVRVAKEAEIREAAIRASSAAPGHKFTLQFLVSEWEQIVDAWQIRSWEAYRDVPRLGRKTRLAEPQRATLWRIFEAMLGDLRGRGLQTASGIFARLADSLAGGARKPFEFAVVDESQDLGVQHLKFLAALGGGRPDALFFAGDLGQRIFQQPFSWKAVGVDIRGRSRTLRVNYRTSHQIRAQADRLLGPEVTDADGITEERGGTVSVFNGPPPRVQLAAHARAESELVGAWLAERVREGVQPQEMGVFVRSAAEIERAKDSLNRAAIPFKVLDDTMATTTGHAALSTMHLAKGLEFRCVAVMACDDTVLPLQSRIEAAGEDSDVREAYDTERHLLYVACTRARDHLLVTAVKPGSEFLEDMVGSGKRSSLNR